MEDFERDDTQDWILSESARPPLLSDLERRIDEAVVTARASEAAVRTVGAAALDAAKQARRAAELAERASAAMLADRRPSGPATPQVEAPPPQGGSLRSFTERADRVVLRLRQLERSSAQPG